MLFILLLSAVAYYGLWKLVQVMKTASYRLETKEKPDDDPKLEPPLPMVDSRTDMDNTYSTTKGLSPN